MHYYKNMSCYRDISDAQWSDWKWQMHNQIKSVANLQQVITLSETEKNEIESCLKQFRMAITPYYASLINPTDPSCPIRMQAVPLLKELNVQPEEKVDPLCEDQASPVAHLVHRYPDRVLLLSTYQCAMYCRHCTRRRLTGEEDFSISDKAIENCLRYLRQHEEVRDVLISGGDPLIMSDKRLEEIISRLRAISHIEIIRIGTRVPVVMPMRITIELTKMLKKYQPIWVNTHFNHPKELTPEALRSCAMLVDAGIPVGNQSVLLKGVNDDVNTMKTLLLKLVQARVRPYYLYQCDIAKGISHFRTTVDKGISIMEALIGHISGFAIPRYVIDAPGGGGKIPLLPQYLIEKTCREIILRNYQGNIYSYPDSQMH